MEIFLRRLTANWNYFWAKTRHKFIDKCAQSVLQNLDIINAVDAAFSSMRFEKKYLKEVPYFKKRVQLYKFCFDQAKKGGLNFEFGVYKGDSINLWADIDRSIHFVGFDSFEGLPERWTIGAKTGAFNVKGNLPKVRKNVSLVKGFFENTLHEYIKKNISSNDFISVLHIDCDLYSATKFVLNKLNSFITPGTVIVIDEYYNYGDWEEGEYKAVNEWCAEYHREFEYLAYVRIGSQLAIKITK